MTQGQVPGSMLTPREETSASCCLICACLSPVIKGSVILLFRSLGQDFSISRDLSIPRRLFILQGHLVSMPSQKRYRQNQENNNSVRFRDLPPRFKRQKSSSSPASLETPKSTLINCSVEANSQEFNKSSATMAPTSIYPLEENLSPRLRTNTHIIQTPQMVSPTWQLPQKLNGAFVLSPWDNRLCERVNNTQSPHVPLGTHFGYKLESPPLSPWASTGSSNLSGQSITGSPTWMSPRSDLCTGHFIYNSSGLNNENWAPTEKVKFHSNPPALWHTTSPVSSQEYNSPVSSIIQSNLSFPARGRSSSVPSPIQSSLSFPMESDVPSPIQSPLSLIAEPSVKNNYNEDMQTNAKQSIDYSDPDIRTIVMLRELERVADEKDSESNDFGTDRKSLVSHHLRMLMCAVDRYTEGIDEDITSRSDEVIATESCLPTPASSPGPKKIWPQKQSKEISRLSKFDLAEQCPPNIKTAAYKGPVASQVSISSGHLTVPAHNRELFFPTPLVKPVMQQQKNTKDQETASWDLWSSPSFDFSCVLTCQGVEDLTRDPFGRFADNDERERKPLYQR